jgi:low affinity Fe/Cu permease
VVSVDTKSEPVMPSDVTPDVSLFDRFATVAATITSRAVFFAACVLIVLIWAPSYFLIKDLNTWQLIINTLTTIVTFLLVALLQNTQTRADAAVQHKLNAIADAMADLMRELAADRPGLDQDRRELAAAVGLEERESA